MTGVVGLMMLVAGCGESTPSAPNAALPTSTSVAPIATEPWDPCTIPDNAVDAAGLDVGSKTTNLFGDAPLSNDWKTCIWTDPDPGSWYFLGAFSGFHSLDDLEANDRFNQFSKVDALGGYQFLRADRPAGRSCGMAFEVEKGLVYFVLDTRAASEPARDPCVEIENIASSTRASLPPISN
ncbi:hypothetical protein RN2511_039860 [Rhodococcus sp. NKCM2511]|uniref:DUF3558 domain-containing protein n=1 Tax=Rhodococcus sp. NKCM2511 TaxID=2766011 RepID=UPI0019110B57|nr:DUF3558 domain-containing protein [Rhodococcus sp. NKCM2511]GHP19250.1 hypothetical protein RN2511_039860 [Rhodococcus sp. NKCM2511]